MPIGLAYAYIITAQFTNTKMVDQLLILPRNHTLYASDNEMNY